MGQLFQQGGLTTPGSALSVPSTGQPTMIGSPEQVLSQQHSQRDADIKSSINNPVMAPKPQAPFLTPSQPSFQQAASAGATPGGANALSPGLNKAGKLVTLLQSGLQGALAGRAKSEETVAATGGRRSGGAGMGFEAGYELPWQRESKQLGLQQQQAGVAATQAQSQMINTPSGPMPAWLAKAILPATIRGQSAENVADTRVQGAKDVQGMRGDTAEDIADKKIKAAQGGLQIPVDETVANLAGMPSIAGKTVGKQDWDTINKALTAKGYKMQDLGQEGMWLLDRGGNRIKRVGESPGVGRMQALAQSRVVAAAANPEEPGNLTYMSAGQAEKTGALAPQSAPTAAAKRAATSEVPTNVGNQKVAFNTAIQHADLLKKAFASVQNGDMQLWNGIKNRVKTEFGWSEPPTADLIAGVYAGEINKLINAGHITQQELDKVGGTVPTNIASPGRMAAALDAYKALAQSKMNMLQQQVDAAKSNPKKPATNEIQWHIENGKLVQGAAAPR